MRQSHWMIIISVLLIITAFILPACSSPTPEPEPTASPTETPAAPITLKLGYDTPPTTSLGVPAEYFAKEVTERTQGRVTVETYPAGALSTMESALKTLRAGVADIYVMSITARDEFPVLSLCSLPELDFFPHTAELINKEVATVKDIIATYPAAAAEVEGLRMLYSNTYTSNVFMGTGSPVRVPADLDGKKVGTGGFTLDMVEYLGGAPVSTHPPFMYEQLQTGVTDLVAVAWMAANEWQLFEQVTWTLDVPMGGGQLPCYITNDAWNRISAADQKIVLETADDAQQVNNDFLVGAIPEARQKWAETASIEVIVPSDEDMALWEEAFKVVWDEYLEVNKGVADIDKIFNHWKDTIYSTR